VESNFSRKRVRMEEVAAKRGEGATGMVVVRLVEVVEVVETVETVETVEVVEAVETVGWVEGRRREEEQGG
jgi:hypothetical protein